MKTRVLLSSMFAICALAGSAVSTEALAQQQKCQTQLCFDQADLARDKADLKARQADEKWEIKKNGGCGARCQNDRKIENQDKQRIKDDLNRIEND